jgi:predicted small secreted protein
MMKKLILLIAILLTGCTVLQTAQTEMKNEVAGFKEDWQRTFGRERTN